jgi:RimK family alpha-L-glutamate ligase
MLEGWLLYFREDYEKNRFFADKLIASGSEKGLYIKLIFAEEIYLGIMNPHPLTPSPKGSGEGERIVIGAPPRTQNAEGHFPHFVINRTRGCRVFNSAEAARVCNDKMQSHLLAARLGLPQVDMAFCRNAPEELTHHGLGYPVVLKSPYGHSGSEVFLVNNKAELVQAASKLKCERVIIQHLCGRPGEDVRVYVLGGKILAAVKRRAETGFRANLSLGGGVEPYELNAEGREMVECVTRALWLDYAGIDFLVGSDGALLFNELEDAVGSRSLYTLGSQDAAALYAGYISETLGSIKTSGN